MMKNRKIFISKILVSIICILLASSFIFHVSAESIDEVVSLSKAVATSAKLSTGEEVSLQADLSYVEGLEVSKVSNIISYKSTTEGVYSGYVYNAVFKDVYDDSSWYGCYVEDGRSSAYYGDIIITKFNSTGLLYSLDLSSDYFWKGKIYFGGFFCLGDFLYLICSDLRSDMYIWKFDFECNFVDRVQVSDNGIYASMYRGSCWTVVDNIYYGIHYIDSSGYSLCEFDGENFKVIKGSLPVSTSVSSGVYLYSNCVNSCYVIDDWFVLPFGSASPSTLGLRINILSGEYERIDWGGISGDSSCFYIDGQPYILNSLGLYLGFSDSVVLYSSNGSSALSSCYLDGIIYSISVVSVSRFVITELSVDSSYWFDLMDYNSNSTFIPDRYINFSYLAGDVDGDYNGDGYLGLNLDFGIPSSYYETNTVTGFEFTAITSLSSDTTVPPIYVDVGVSGEYMPFIGYDLIANVNGVNVYAFTCTVYTTSSDLDNLDIMINVYIPPQNVEHSFCIPVSSLTITRWEDTESALNDISDKIDNLSSQMGYVQGTLEDIETGLFSGDPAEQSKQDEANSKFEDYNSRAEAEQSLAGEVGALVPDYSMDYDYADDIQGRVDGWITGVNGGTSAKDISDYIWEITGAGAMFTVAVGAALIRFVLETRA